MSAAGPVPTFLRPANARHPCSSCCCVSPRLPVCPGTTSRTMTTSWSTPCRARRLLWLLQAWAAVEMPHRSTACPTVRCTRSPSALTQPPAAPCRYTTSSRELACRHTTQIAVASGTAGSGPGSGPAAEPRTCGFGGTANARRPRMSSAGRMRTLWAPAGTVAGAEEDQKDARSAVLMLTDFSWCHLVPRSCWWG